MICLVMNEDTGHYKVCYCRRDYVALLNHLQAGNHAPLTMVARYGGDEFALQLACEQLKPWLARSHYTGNWYTNAIAVRDWFTVFEEQGDARKLALEAWRVRWRPSSVSSERWS